MIKEFIGTGKTVEEATQNAKLQLNAPEMADVHVEVIKYPEKKKFFGLIGGCDAEVKVSYDDGNSEKSKKKENKKLSGHSPCYFDDKSTIHTSRRPFESNYKILR